MGPSVPAVEVGRAICLDAYAVRLTGPFEFLPFARDALDLLEIVPPPKRAAIKMEGWRNTDASRIESMRSICTWFGQRNIGEQR